jgi:hypothetical protein
MNKAEELNNKLAYKLGRLDLENYVPFWQKMDDYGKAVAHNRIIETPSLYEKWLLCLMEEICPKQIIELGAWRGISTCMILAGIPKDSKFYSVDIDPLSWEYVPEDSRLTKVIGDDLDLSIYPKDLDLGKTDFWFIDTNHTEEFFRKERDVYEKFWKPGTVIAMDDVGKDSGFTLWKEWDKLPYDKVELPTLHHTSFGLIVI